MCVRALTERQPDADTPKCIKHKRRLFCYKNCNPTQRFVLAGNQRASWWVQWESETKGALLLGERRSPLLRVRAGAPAPIWAPGGKAEDVKALLTRA